MQQISYNSVEDITDDIRKQIGWRIQEKRIEKGITAVDLSTYLNITANQVSRIESKSICWNNVWSGRD